MALTLGLSLSATARRFSLVVVLLFIGVTGLVALGASRAASDAEWTVLAASGKAEWRGPDAKVGGWQGLELNGRVPDGAEIRTGGDGNAVVAKGLDRIDIRPGTVLVVAARQSAKGAMEIDQTAGSATYTVEKRPAGTFSVHTPYVVAVVKGTKFDVDVTAEDTSVAVSEGRVGVSDSRSGESRDVNPGQRATSSRSAAGIDVSEAPAENAATPTSKAAGIGEPGANPNPSPNANANASTRGNSASAPGQTGETPGRSGEAPGRSGEGGQGNASGNGGSGGANGGGGSDGGSGGGSGGGSDGGSDGGSGGGNGGGGSGGGSDGGSGSGGSDGGSGGGNGGGNGKGKDR